jgi:hypothetical protein
MTLHGGKPYLERSLQMLRLLVLMCWCFATELGMCTPALTVWPQYVDAVKHDSPWVL